MPAPDVVVSVIPGGERSHTRVFPPQGAASLPPLIPESITAPPAYGVGAVVLRQGAQADRESLREFVHERLASFKKPDVVQFFSDLPKTATGKVIKRELTPLFEPGAGAAGTDPGGD